MSIVATGELKAHYDKANQLAMSIFCQTQASIPSALESEFSEQILIQVSEFALHARRAWDLSGLKITSGKMSFLTPHGGPEIDSLSMCGDYFEAIGIIMHARDIKLNYIKSDGNGLFSNSNNMSVAFIQAKTDKKPEQNISIMGISWFFLSEIRGAILQKYGSKS